MSPYQLLEVPLPSSPVRGRPPGNHQDTDDLLPPSHSWFTERFDTTDLKEGPFHYRQFVNAT